MKLDFIYKYTAFNKPSIIPEQRNTDEGKEDDGE
jgi:hypothetical protein